jgi:hypothetical protein
MVIERSNGQTGTSAQRVEHLKALLVELSRLAERRVTSVSEHTYATFAEDLMPYELRDVREAF